MLKKICIAFSLLLVPSLIFAGLTIEPSRVEVALPAGGMIIGTFTVTNDYADTIDMTIQPKAWFTLPENKNFSIEDWIRPLVTEAAQFKPGEKIQVPFEVHVPSGAVGSQATMMSFMPQSPTEQGINLVMSIAVYITVSGTQYYKWNVTDIAVKQMQGQVQASVLIKNEGNMYIRPTGHINITNEKKQVLARLAIPEGRPVYPGQEQAIIGINEGQLTLGKGKYIAVVTVMNGTQEEVVTAKFTVDDKGKIQLKFKKK